MPQLLPTDPRRVGDVIAPYTRDGVFVEDFWMKDRVGAQKGASVKEYGQALITLGQSGTTDLHTHILGPDQPDKYWNEVMRTSGDLHWNPRWNSYFWNPDLDDQQNLANWISCGRPHQNQYGIWAGTGVPPELDEWRKMHATERWERYGNTIPGKRPHKRRR